MIKLLLAVTLTQWMPYVNEDSLQTREQWLPVVKAAAEHYELDWKLLDALIWAESNWNANAESHAGAQGLAQLMPQTAYLLKVKDPFNPAHNIWGAAWYLRKLHNRFKDWTLTLAAYNAGPTRVTRCKCVPNISETQIYVKRVIRIWKPENVKLKRKSKAETGMQ